MIRFAPGGFLKSGFNAVNAGPVSYGSALFLVTGTTTGDIVGGRGATTIAQTTSGGATQKWAYGSLSIPENGSNSILTYTTNVSGLKLDTSKTFDCWVYVSNSNLNAGISVYKLGLYTAWVGAAYVSFNVICVNNSGGTKWGLEVVTSSLSTRFWTTEVITPNTWTHVALEVDSGGTAYVYCGGNKITTTAAGSPSGTPTFTLSGTVDRVDIGQASDSGTGCFIQDARVSTQRYAGAATYTVPTASAMAGFTWKVPNTAITDPDWAYVSMLLHGDGSNGSSTVTDSSGLNTMTATGSVVLDTSFSAFGTASIRIPGSGTLRCPNASRFAPGTGDFRYELAVKFNTIVAYGNLGGTNQNGNNETGSWFLEASNSRGLVFCDGGTVYSVSYTFSTGVLYYIAVCRTGTTLRFFINGTQVGADQTVSTNLSATTGNFGVGCYGSAGTGQVDAWIDEARFTKGVPRQTTNHSVQTAAFPNS